MNNTVIRHLDSQVVDEDMHLTLLELCQACSTSTERIETWVFEGVLEPAGEHPYEWRFNGPLLRRAHLAQRLAEDMEINASGIALALDLLDRIEELKAELQRTSHY
jgi:chaperone modulatory protein CbpM